VIVHTFEAQLSDFVTSSGNKSKKSHTQLEKYKRVKIDKIYEEQYLVL
jgi:hypothetical protein